MTKPKKPKPVEQLNMFEQPKPPKRPRKWDGKDWETLVIFGESEVKS